MTTEEIPLSPEADALQRAQLIYDRAEKRSSAARSTMMAAYKVWQEAFAVDLRQHPEVPHTVMAARWNVAESTVRWRRSRMATPPAVSGGER
jgi:hypothetical protein